MGVFSQRAGLQAGRAVFRWCRIAFWFVLLLAVGALSFLYVVGLPDFLKPLLLQKIRERGFNARFTSARLGWGPAIVIENAGFDPTNHTSGPRLSAGLTEVQLNWNALLHRHLRADSVQVFNGQIKIPVSDRFGKVLSLDRVHLTLRLFSNDVAQLSDFGASFRGIRIRIDGDVTNFASLSNWKLPARWQSPSAKLKPGPQAPVTDILDEFHFSQNPRLDIHFSADGRDMNTLRAEALFTAPDVDTPWGNAGEFQLRAAAAHLLDFTHRPFMQARVNAGNIATRWGSAGNVSLTAAFFPDSSAPFNTYVNFAGADLEGIWDSPSGADWVSARRLAWDGAAALSPANFKPTALEGTLRVAGVDSPWGSAGALAIALKTDRAELPAPADKSWGIWTRFSRYLGSCRFAATNIQSPELRLDSLSLNAAWSAPQLAIGKLEARLYEGRLGGGADLNIDSRQLHFHAVTDFNPGGISQLLTPSAQRWISQFTWGIPPAVNAEIRLVLPPWTNRPEGWRNDLRDSVEIAGDFSAGAASFRKIEVTSASAHVFYTNRVWTVPRLNVTRADGSINVDYTANEATEEFHVLLDSRMDPAAALPWLEPQQQDVLRELHFTSPPEIHAEAHGHWNYRETTAFSGTVLASNFTARGESFDGFSASAEYTNHLLRVSDLGLFQGAGHLEIPLVSADFESKRISLTNAQSTMDPRLVLVGMGTNAPDFLRLIHFDVPPTVRASGSFVLGDSLATDMRFEIQGNHFHWTNLGADKISGSAQWEGRNVTLTNIQAQLYNSGSLSGWLAFDSAPGRTAGFRSDFTAKNIDLGVLARDLNGKSGKLEGKFDANMTLDAPATADKETWMGHGYVHIHEALLWEIKIFGILSPMLNAMSPGLGDSHAREASAHFTVAGGKVSSDDLEIHSTGVRLLYRGSITMDKKLDGRVEADLLRDMPVFGPFLSLALKPLSKLFEYQLTGSMRQPVFKPLYLPKFFMLLLRPFHNVKDPALDAPATLPPKDGK